MNYLRKMPGANIFVHNCIEYVCMSTCMYLCESQTHDNEGLICYGVERLKEKVQLGIHLRLWVQQDNDPKHTSTSCSGLRHCISVQEASLQSLVRIQAVSHPDVIGSPIVRRTIGPASSGFCMCRPSLLIRICP